MIVDGNVTIIRDVVYGTGGDVPLLLDIYIPETTLSNPMPPVVYIHGGGWSSGDKYPSQARLLVETGFIGVSRETASRQAPLR